MYKFHKLFLLSVFVLLILNFDSISAVPDYNITNCEQLQNMSQDLKGHYQLMNDIDCSASKQWNSGAGFTPIGNSQNAFQGVLEGNQHSITNLYMNHPNTDGVGLFGIIGINGSIYHVVLVTPHIYGIQDVGAFAGGSVGGTLNQDGVNGGEIMAAGNTVGGLVGRNNGAINQSYSSSVFVSGANFVGGVVGQNTYNGSISGTITNSYSGGLVKGVGYVGGFVGGNWTTIQNCYTTAQVEGNENLGGFTASNYGSINDSYWSSSLAGVKQSAGGTLETTKNLMQSSTYNGWDFSKIWRINEGYDYPQLMWQPKSNQIDIKFMTIASPVKVETAFPVSLQASSSSFNGTVSLSSTRGIVIPQVVTLTNGVWQGDITIFNAGDNAALQASWVSDPTQGLQSITSNLFNVLDLNGSLPNNASLQGKITDSRGNAVVNADVELYNQQPDGTQQPVAKVTADSNGLYSLENLIPGNYFLQASKQGYQPESKIVSAESQHIVTGNLQLYTDCSQLQGAAKVPVLLIPGIMGSNVGSKLNIYPTLGTVPLKWYDKKLKFFAQGILGWNNLVSELEKNGYTLGCNLFKVPYDWALPAAEIRKNYLIPNIENAKRKTGSNKVNIIAYSMGGVLARSYIQSNDYQNDVDKFAMIGSPNMGAGAAYYMWQGSDPVLASQIANIKLLKYFYAHALDKLFRLRAKEQRRQKGACTFYTDALTGIPPRCDKRKLYRFVHDQVRSLGELVPVYNFALSESGNYKAINVEENGFLKSLDGIPCASPNNCNPYSFISANKILTSDNKGVQTKIFYSTGTSTLNSIVVSNAGTYPQYQDGVPTGSPEKNNGGDGTVISSSVLMPDMFPTPLPNESTPNVIHKNLINEFTGSVVDFITNNSHVHHTASNSSNDTKALVVTIRGNVNLILDDEPITTPKPIFDNGFNVSTIEFQNPTDGQYQYDIKSVDNKNYSIEIAYINTATNSSYYQQVIDVPPNNNNRSFTVSFNNDEIHINDRSFMAPTHQAESNSNGEIYLRWQDATGDSNHDVDHYNIYALSKTDPYYHLIGESNTKSYNTMQPWSDSSDDAFLIQSVLKNGETTVTAGPVFNTDDN